MPFKDGKYVHDLGFEVLVLNGKPYLNGALPLSIRLTDMFNVNKWKEVKENGSTNQG